METFEWQGHRLVYESFGTGPRTFVYIPGLVLDAALNRDLALRLAERGHHVVVPELLGHGRSDTPLDPGRHRVDSLVDQTVGLLDHLGLAEAVVGGVSLGANVALGVAAEAPGRVRGVVAEMPVLEKGSLFGLTVFPAVVQVLRRSGAIGQLVTRMVGHVPRTGLGALDSWLAMASRPPQELATVLLGLMLGPGVPPASVLRTIQTPTLIIGHPFDPLHPWDDATMLADELVDARLVRAWSLAEARVAPRRIVGHMARFLDDVWSPRLAHSRAHG